MQITHTYALASVLAGESSAAAIASKWNQGMHFKENCVAFFFF